VAGLTSQERLQPSLLDRLTDHERGSSREALDARVLSRNQLREAVLRDLTWLFNAVREEPDPDSDDVDRVRLWRSAPLARDSVVNFGIPALSGTSLNVLDFPRLEEAIRQCIVRFEPRIDADTLSVEVGGELANGLRPSNLRLVIRGQMWNQPVPLELLLSADVDVDTGQAAVRDMRR
jgi:type VI secretion system protein ImpF